MSTNLTDDQRELLQRFFLFLNGAEDPTWSICTVGPANHDEWGILSLRQCYSEVMPEFDKWLGETT